METTTTVLVAKSRKVLIQEVLPAWIAQVGPLGTKEVDVRAARWHRAHDRWELPAHFTPFAPQPYAAMPTIELTLALTQLLQVLGTLPEAHATAVWGEAATMQAVLASREQEVA